MAQKIIVKKSTIPGKVPTTADLSLGEFCVNSPDRIIYYRQPDTGNIVTLGGDSGAPISSTPPSNPTAGALWIEESTLRAFAFYDNAWVEILGQKGDKGDKGDTGASGASTWADIAGKPTFSTVATSGSYTDLLNKPTLGTAAATNASAYATAAQGAKADTASQPGHAHAISDVTGLQTALTSKGSSADVQIFTSSGTWTKPAGAKSVDVVVIAGGGGGSSGRVNAGQWGGAGGGGGSYSSRKAIPASVLGSTEAVTVGQGGIGGAAVNTPNAASNAGTAGGTSSFGEWVFAGGGSGATGGNGPAGGSATGRNESSGGFGGSGGNGTAGSAAANNGNFGAGGGGGGGGCTTAGVFGIGGNGFPSFLTVSIGGQSLGGQTSGANGATGHTINSPGYSGGGGAGGAGHATGNGGNGGNGGLYGGGGGGGGCCGWYPGTSGLTYSSGKGGDGAQGVVVVTTYF